MSFTVRVAHLSIEVPSTWEQLSSTSVSTGVRVEGPGGEVLHIVFNFRDESAPAPTIDERRIQFFTDHVDHDIVDCGTLTIVGNPEFWGIYSVKDGHYVRFIKEYRFASRGLDFRCVAHLGTRDKAHERNAIYDDIMSTVTQ